MAYKSKLRTHGGNALGLFHPPLWTEYVCVLAKYVLVLMDDPRICANARLHNISMHNTHQEKLDVLLQG